MLFPKMSKPGIAEFYSGKHVLITGATGFMGKVLVEKLLRSCPDISQIYIIVRSKKGKSPEQRWNELTNLELFDLLKEKRPEALSTKLTVLDGDVSEHRLGLRDEDYTLLVDNASVIFHAAASVRFNEPLHEAVKMNMYGTKQVVDLALQAKNLKVFQHVSTAYCNCDRGTEIEEKVYPPKYDWKEVISITEKTDPIELAALTKKYLGEIPNTYVFSKSLAEQIVWEVRDKLPLVIFRPSIVISSWKDPVPGWIDNFNGPIGLNVGAAKGVIRTVLTDPDIVPDYMAVDIAIKAMIISAWKRATTNTEFDENEFVHHCASTYKSLSYGNTVKAGVDTVKKFPLDGTLWYPGVSMQKNITMFKIQTFFKHLLPAFFIDTLLKFLGKEPQLLKIQIKVQTAILALSYFTLQEWKFRNDNFLNLLNFIPKGDMDDFDFNLEDLDPSDYFLNAAMAGSKKYLLHENGDHDYTRKKFKRLKWLHYTVLTLFYSGCTWILFNVLVDKFAVY